jgi:GT2 family glycosyltransferase
MDRLDLTKKAVNSVLEKSVNNIKIVFLDNNSKDGTIDYLDGLKRKYPNMIDILRSNYNLGVAKGRNRVFRHVVSKYGDGFSFVLNLDNDCIVHDYYDSAISNSISETGALAVCPKLIQPDGRIFHNSYDGFLINLNEMQLQLEYGDNVNMHNNDPKVNQRRKTDVLLGTSAKTPEFLKKIGYYDEGHEIGWEDFSLALRALGLSKSSFYNWKNDNAHNGKDWVPLRTLLNGHAADMVAMYEPKCVITHDHPVTERDQRYEKARWNPQVIQRSTEHFENVWGIKPLL